MKILLRIAKFRFRINFQYSVFYFLFFFLISCENDIDQVNSITAKNNYPVESAKNIEVVFSDSGKLKVKLNAPEMLRYTGDRPYMEMPKGVNVLFYNNMVSHKEGSC